MSRKIRQEVLSNLDVEGGYTWEDVDEVYFGRAPTKVSREVAWIRRPDGRVMIVTVMGPFTVDEDDCISPAEDEGHTC